MEVIEGTSSHGVRDGGINHFISGGGSVEPRRPKPPVRAFLFDDDDVEEGDDAQTPRTARRGSLHRHNWVEEQKKTLLLLHERHLDAIVSLGEMPTRASDCEPLLTFRPLETTATSAGTPPLEAHPSTNAMRKNVPVAEGEDPLSALDNSRCEEEFDEDFDEPSTVMPVSEGAESRAAHGETGDEVTGKLAEEPNDAVCDGLRTGDVGLDFEDLSLDDENTRRRSQRLAFSVTVHLCKKGRLGIGISELADGSVSVTRLDRGGDGGPGCAETAGLAINDRLLGANFEPFKSGLKSVVELFQEAKRRDVLCLQVLRDPVVNPTAPPGFRHYPAVARLLAQAGALGKAQFEVSDTPHGTAATVTSDAESTRFLMVAAILGVMARQEETHGRLNMPTALDPAADSSATAVGDTPFLSPLRRPIDKIFFRAKGLREAICIRVVDTLRENADTVMYVLRVEDVESGQWWLSSKRYRDLAALHHALNNIWPPAAELAFPQKIIASNRQPAVIEERVVGLESFLRDCVALLTLYACADARAALALRHLQSFVGVNEHVDDCASIDAAAGETVGMLPSVPSPPLEGKAVELVAFSLLAGDSSARDEAHALLTTFHRNQIVGRCLEEAAAKTVEREAASEDGECGRDSDSSGAGSGGGFVLHELVLREVALRINHLQQFLLSHHLTLLTRAEANASLANNAGAPSRPPATAAAAEVDMKQQQHDADAGNRSSSYSNGVTVVSGGEEGGLGGGAPPLPSGFSEEESSKGDGAMAMHDEDEEVLRSQRVLESAVRRQCEATVFLSLRRFLPRALDQSLAPRGAVLQRRLHALHVTAGCGPGLDMKGKGQTVASVLQVEEGMSKLAPREWKKAVLSFERMAAHLLPCDMVSALCDVSHSVLALHGAVTRGGQEKRASHRRKQKEWETTEARASQRIDALKRASRESDGTQGTRREGGAQTFSTQEVVVATEGVVEDREEEEEEGCVVAMSADDFLPIFTLVMIHAEPPDLLCVAELCSNLLDPYDAISERGYCVASLQAAINIVLHLQVDGVSADGSVDGSSLAVDGESSESGEAGALSLVRRMSLAHTLSRRRSSTRQSWAMK